MEEFSRVLTVPPLAEGWTFPLDLNWVVHDETRKVRNFVDIIILQGRKMHGYKKYPLLYGGERVKKKWFLKTPRKIIMTADLMRRSEFCRNGTLIKSRETSIFNLHDSATIRFPSERSPGGCPRANQKPQ